MADYKTIEVIEIIPVDVKDTCRYIFAAGDDLEVAMNQAIDFVHKRRDIWSYAMITKLPQVRPHNKQNDDGLHLYMVEPKCKKGFYFTAWLPSNRVNNMTLYKVSHNPITLNKFYQDTLVQA